LAANWHFPLYGINIINLRVDIIFSKPSALSEDGSAHDAARYLVLPGSNTTYRSV